MSAATLSNDWKRTVQSVGDHSNGKIKSIFSVSATVKKRLLTTVTLTDNTFSKTRIARWFGVSTDNQQRDKGQMFVSAGVECPNCGRIVRRCGVIDFRPHPDDETTACVFRSEDLKRWSGAFEYVYAYHRDESQSVQAGTDQ